MTEVLKIADKYDFFGNSPIAYHEAVSLLQDLTDYMSPQQKSDITKYNGNNNNLRHFYDRLNENRDDRVKRHFIDNVTDIGRRKKNRILKSPNFSTTYENNEWLVFSNADESFGDSLCENMFQIYSLTDSYYHLQSTIKNILSTIQENENKCMFSDSFGIDVEKIDIDKYVNRIAKPDAQNEQDAKLINEDIFQSKQKQQIYENALDVIYRPKPLKIVMAVKRFFAKLN